MANESLRARQLPMVVPPDRTGSASRKPRTAPPHPLATRKRGVERRAGADDRHVNGPERARAQTVRPWPCTARVPVQDGSPCVFDPPGPLCALSHATPPTPLPTPDHSLPTGGGWGATLSPLASPVEGSKRTHRPPPHPTAHARPLASCPLSGDGAPRLHQRLEGAERTHCPPMAVRRAFIDAGRLSICLRPARTAVCVEPRRSTHPIAHDQPRAAH